MKLIDAISIAAEGRIITIAYTKDENEKFDLQILNLDSRNPLDFIAPLIQMTRDQIAEHLNHVTIDGNIILTTTSRTGDTSGYGLQLFLFKHEDSHTIHASSHFEPEYIRSEDTPVYNHATDKMQHGGTVTGSIDEVFPDQDQARYINMFIDELYQITHDNSALLGNQGALEALIQNV